MAANQGTLRLTRRGFLRAAGATSAALAGASLLPAAASRALAAPVRLRGLQGQEISVLIWGHVHKAIQPIVDEFTQQTGISVKLEAGVSGGGNQVEQLSTYYQAGEAPFDVSNEADEGGVSFMTAGFLEPLDDYLPAGFWDDFAPFMETIKVWYQSGGKTYRILNSPAYEFFWYRKDWLDAAGISAPPDTWDDLVEVGKRFAGEGGKAGFADALAKGGFNFVSSSTWVQQAGGDPFAYDEGSRVGLKFMHDLIYEHKIWPASYLTKNYDQLNEDYMKDLVFSLRQWNYFYDVTRGNTAWYSAGKAEVALFPKGPAEGQQGRASWWGAWGWTMPKFAKNKEAAARFITWMSTPDAHVKLAKAHGTFLGPFNSVVEQLDPTEYPLLAYEKMYQDAGVITTRPFHRKYNEAQSIWEDIVSSYLANQISLDDAMKQGKQKTEALGPRY